MLQSLILKQFAQHYVTSDHLLIKPRGMILEIDLDPKQTKFDINDYIKLSKKSSRSMRLEKQIKPTLQYSIVGKCIRFQKKGINTSFLIRNVITLVPFEMTFAFFTSFITNYIIRDFTKPNSRLKYKRGNQYHLRRVSRVRSRIVFDYVVDRYWD
jgi:ribosomal protein L19